MPWRCMGEWMYKSSFSWPRHWLEVSGQLHSSAALPPWGKSPCTHWIGGWVDSRASLDDTVKWKFLALPGLEIWPLGHPVIKPTMPLKLISSMLRNRNISMFHKNLLPPLKSLWTWRRKYHILLTSVNNTMLILLASGYSAMLGYSYSNMVLYPEANKINIIFVWANKSYHHDNLPSLCQWA
jgi:hypothetical protein